MNKKLLIGLGILMSTTASGCSKKEKIDVIDEEISKDLNSSNDKTEDIDENETISKNESIYKNDTSSNLELARNSYIEGEEPLYINGILVVNKEFGLPRNFASELNPEALDAFHKMKQEAKEQGITLNIRSGFRDTNTQEILFNTYAQRDGIENANRYSAKPCHSEHETGLAIDITNENTSKSIGDWFNETDEAKWLYENAYKYGFILRYPDGKEDITGYKYESWHYRYVGTEHSKNFKMNNLTLEEYLKIVNTN